MTSLFERLDKRKRKDIRVLANFIGVFCRQNHCDALKTAFFIRDQDLQSDLEGLSLCSECGKLLEHGIAKLSLCPYDPKPSCRKCPAPCYAPGYRERVRRVMRFSSSYLIRHGRLDLLLHYLK